MFKSTVNFDYSTENIIFKQFSLSAFYVLKLLTFIHPFLMKDIRVFLYLILHFVMSFF